jgi:hypothetical protein
MELSFATFLLFSKPNISHVLAGSKEQFQQIELKDPAKGRQTRNSIKNSQFSSDLLVFVSYLKYSVRTEQCVHSVCTVYLPRRQIKPQEAIVAMPFAALSFAKAARRVQSS